MQWLVPREWEGQTAYIIGGGPSLRQEDVDLLKGKNVIAVTNQYKLAPWAPVKYFGDCQFWRWQGVRFSKLPGYLVTICYQCRDDDRLLFLKCTGMDGIEDRPDCLRSTHSGQAAVNLAYLMGAVRIILVGFDMRAIGGQCNWHTDYPKSARVDIYEKRFIPKMGTLVEPLKKRGIEVLNATPGSALPFWPIVNLRDVLVP